jgi:hypothetical protein
VASSAQVFILFAGLVTWVFFPQVARLFGIGERHSRTIMQAIKSVVERQLADLKE